MRKGSFLTSTTFLPGLFLFLLLGFLPTARFAGLTYTSYFASLAELPEHYRKLGIPSMTYANGEMTANNNEPFQRQIQNRDPKKSFMVIMDTRPNVNSSGYLEAIRKGGGGILVLRTKAVIYNTEKMEEKTIPFGQIPFVFTLDESTIELISHKAGKPLYFLFLLIVFIFHLTGKGIQWGILSLYYSGKAKTQGGGNYSLALWILTLPTFFQVLFYQVSLPCCVCGFYFLILIVSALVMEKSLRWPPRENKEEA